MLISDFLFSLGVTVGAVSIPNCVETSNHLDTLTISLHFYSQIINFIWLVNPETCRENPFSICFMENASYRRRLLS